MKRTPVQSSVIKSLGYDEATSRLEVEFVREGDVYEYRMVPASTYRELMQAESLGAYFDLHVRHTFPYTRID